MTKNIDFHDIVLDASTNDVPCFQDENDLDQKRRKRIKRVLRFSDGDMEEYSSEDEKNSTDQPEPVSHVDPNTLEWAPWAWYKTAKAGSKVLEACDYMGEILADFLGITGPKYQFEIEEYKKMNALRNKRNQQDLEMSGWYKGKEDNLLQKNMIINQNNVGTHI